MPVLILRITFSQVAGVLGDIRVVHAVEHETGGLRALIMAADAVLTGNRVVERWRPLGRKKERNGHNKPTTQIETQGYVTRVSFSTVDFPPSAS